MADFPQLTFYTDKTQALTQTLQINHWYLQLGFSQIDEIGNNANIGISGFTTWKNPVTKCYL